jgi:hypothetical protein
MQSMAALATLALVVTACDGAAAPDSGVTHRRDASPARDVGPARDTGPVVVPSADWVDMTSNLRELASGRGDIGPLAWQPGTRRILAGVAGAPTLFATDDGGASWLALGSGAGSASLGNGPTGIIFDPDDPTHYWESGIYGPGVFRTTDDGVSFVRLGDISHNDLVSIDFTDPARATLLAGGHEQTHTLYLSRNGGASWENIGANVSDPNFTSTPLVLDRDTFLLGTWGGAGSIQRSTNGGESWTAVYDRAPAGRPLRASDGTIYWPLFYDAGIAVSRDEGLTWDLATGPVHPRGGPPIELPDGRVLALGHDFILASSDRGTTWEPIGSALPFPGQNCGTYGFAYAVSLRTLFIHQNDCSGRVANSSVWSSGFDYETD